MANEKKHDSKHPSGNGNGDQNLPQWDAEVDRRGGDMELASGPNGFQERDHNPGLMVAPYSSLELAPSGLPEVAVPPYYNSEHSPSMSGTTASSGAGFAAGAGAHGPTWTGYQEKLQHEAGQNGQPYPPAVEGGGGGDSEERTMYGLKRKTVLICLFIAIFLALAAIGIGVGLGVGLKDNDDQPAASPATTSTVSTPTTTQPSPSSTAEGTYVDPDFSCPGTNKTTYTYTDPDSPNTERQFTFFCGRDYDGRRPGNQDLGPRIESETMKGCIDRCGAEERCVGVGWGGGGYYRQWDKYCYLKQKLGDSPNWEEDWWFAELVGYHESKENVSSSTYTTTADTGTTRVTATAGAAGTRSAAATN